MGSTSTRSGKDDPDPVLNQIWYFAWTEERHAPQNL